jgi:hypothetical protein
MLLLEHGWMDFHEIYYGRYTIQNGTFPTIGNINVRDVQSHEVGQ